MGPVKFDEPLRNLGATWLGQCLTHRASGDAAPEEEAIAWNKEWVALLAKMSAAAE
jgi:hypothetical protein